MDPIALMKMMQRPLPQTNKRKTLASLFPVKRYIDMSIEEIKKKK